MSWTEHLQAVCAERTERDQYPARKKKIEESMTDEGYPDLDEREQHAIRVIANSLYENIKGESNKALELYEQLHEAFVKQGD